MNRHRLASVAALMIATALSVAPAQAQLLGNDGGLVDLDSGPAGDDALVNVGIGDGGGDNGNILDVQIGDDNDIAGVTVENRNRGLGIDVDLLDDTVTGTVDLLGGDGNILTADLDLSGLGLDIDFGLDLGLGIGGPGGPGGPGSPGGPGGPGGGPGGSGASGTGGGGGAAGRIVCDLDEAWRLLQFAATGQYSTGAGSQ